MKSDLTIGDAWGIKNFAPEMFDNRGVSVVFIHTAKGKDFFERTDLKIKQVKFIDAIVKNPYSISPTIADLRRENFFADFANSADKFAVMEKYYYQEDEEILKKVRKLNRISFQKNYREIAAQIRKKFRRNILVLSPNLDDNTKKILFDYFEQNLSEINLYLLQRTEVGAFVCTENFSRLTFDVKEDLEALKDFAAQFNITEILIDRDSKLVRTENFTLLPFEGKEDVDALKDFVAQFNVTEISINKGYGSDSLALTDWLKNCGLPLKLFSIVRDK